jgi:hypothetical protein
MFLYSERLQSRLKLYLTKSSPFHHDQQPSSLLSLHNCKVGANYRRVASSLACNLNLEDDISGNANIYCQETHSEIEWSCAARIRVSFELFLRIIKEPRVVHKGLRCMLVDRRLRGQKGDFRFAEHGLGIETGAKDEYGGRVVRKCINDDA